MSTVSIIELCRTVSNSVNSVNSVNIVNSVNSYSAVLPPSPMVFLMFVLNAGDDIAGLRV